MAKITVINDGVDAELKTEGQAVLTILETAKTGLETHADFVNWVQP